LFSCSSADPRHLTLGNSVLVDLKFIADPGPSNRRERHLPGTSHYSVGIKCFGSRSTSSVTNSTKRIAFCSNCSVVEPRFLSRFSLALRITARHMSGTCPTIDGRLLRLDGSESRASSLSDRPRPSDDLRIRKMPLISRVRLPSAKTSGMVVNCTSDGERIQKQKAATARIR